MLIVPILEFRLAEHDPVMVSEIVEELALKPGDVAVDGTLGLGGHSEMFARAISPGGTLVATEWDETMLARARERLFQVVENDAPRVGLHLFHDDFRNLSVNLLGLGLKANGILLDLGLNSAQVNDPNRGISFLQDGPLDMRMDRSRGESAASLLNRATPYEIERMLSDYGDERWARRIAQKVVERRRDKPLRTTADLVECVLAAIPVAAREKRIHPATRTFQSVRIAVNGELNGLDEALRSAARSLAASGKLAVLSYHSGEDRVVKQTFRDLVEEGFTDLHKKPLVPSEQEISRNPRSRSAKLRVLQRPGQ